MANVSTKTKVISFSVLWFFALLSVIAVYFAARVSTDYSTEQFLPKKHALLDWDKESKKVFQISEASPDIVLLTFKRGEKGQWFDLYHLNRLEKLSHEIKALENVHSITSLGTVRSSLERNHRLVVGTLSELRNQGFKVEHVLNNPLFAPNLISKDGRHTALFVMPKSLRQDQRTGLVSQIRKMAEKTFPQAEIQVGGSDAIRMQLISSLSREILVFIVLSLFGAIFVLKIMFHGLRILPQVLFILVIANILSFGIVGWMGIPFTIFSSTLPIIVTACSLSICIHTLARMRAAAETSATSASSRSSTFSDSARLLALTGLVRELTRPHLVAALTTGVGFATLMIISEVPLISDYGKAVSAAVMISTITTLMLLPALYLWVAWPRPRRFVVETPRYARLVVTQARWFVPGQAVVALMLALMGFNLSWTARLFDDLPTDAAARRSTELINQHLGGVASVELMVGSNTVKAKDLWKNPTNIKRLHLLAQSWRQEKNIGSVLSLADFLTTWTTQTRVTSSHTALAEMQSLHIRAGESSFRQFLSADERWTRIAVRLPDLPSTQNRATIDKMMAQLNAQFPGLEVKASGLAVIVPPLNDALSRQLMWGFFEALFWIVLLLALVFRSLCWAVLSVLPNFIAAAASLGVLALFDIPVKPGIAIVFTISLGFVFHSTIYILMRLQHILRSSSVEPKSLPIQELLKTETLPCLASGLSLFVGFSIFLFSTFPVNKLLGVFMLISITAGLIGGLVLLPALLARLPWLLIDRNEGKDMKKFSFSWRSAARVSPYLILIVLGLAAFRSTYATTKDAQTILKNVEKLASPPNERVEIKMVIQESDGSKKERELSILRKNEGGGGKEARALIRLKKPSDLKGLSLLTVASGDSEDQWLYLPSDKKSRRILGSNKKGKFLDSDIAYEDLRVSTYKEFDNKVVKDSAKLVQ
ncbi:MAG: MMPL family transporter, partial [Bdellovibrionales bacterium]